MNTQWFKDRLADKKITHRGLAKMMDIDPSAVVRMFGGKRRMTPHEAHQLSVILGTPLNEVMRHAGIAVTEDVRRCPVAAYVNERGVVTLMPPGTHDDRLGPADCPIGTYCVQMRSHASVTDGWLLYVTPAQIPAAANLDQLCIVASGDGKQLLGIIRRGYRKDTHNLVLWPSMETIDDANIVWSSTVLWIRPLY